jgi:hypothetical protein
MQMDEKLNSNVLLPRRGQARKTPLDERKLQIKSNLVA